jgi:hypothetical protein
LHWSKHPAATSQFASEPPHARRAFTSRSSHPLNCPSNLIGQMRFKRPVNGVGRFAEVDGGPRSKEGDEEQE